MQIVIRHEDYSSSRYALDIEEDTLSFSAAHESFAIPYRELRDFCITHDARGKAYFTMLGAGKLYEGQILQPQESKSFVAALNARLDGVISIEVKKL